MCLYIKHGVRLPECEEHKQGNPSVFLLLFIQTARLSGSVSQESKNGCQGRATTEHGSYARTVSAKEEASEGDGIFTVWFVLVQSTGTSITQSCRVKSGVFRLGSLCFSCNFDVMGCE